MSNCKEESRKIGAKCQKVDDSKNVLKKLRKMLEMDSKRFRDIIIIGKNPDEQLCTEDGWKFQIESKVLSDQSKFFHGLFACEDNNRSTLIKGVDGDMLENILIYLDSGKICLNRQNMISTFIWSDFFQINSLKEQCRENILQNLTRHNSLNILITVWRKPTFGLQTECYRYVQLHFERVICASKTWARDLPIELLKTLLSEKSLNIHCESAMWLFIEIWVCENASERFTHVPELLTYISLAELDEELTNEIILSPIVTENFFCMDLNTKRRENESSLTNRSMLLDFALKLQPVQFGPRQPSRLHLITRTKENPDVVEVFLTFDDNYDMWRKVDGLNCTYSCSFESQDVVYFCKSGNSRCYGGTIVGFDLSQDQFFFKGAFSPYSMHMLTVGDCMYFFRDEEIKIFEPETGTYTAIKHQPYPMRTLVAIELNGGIYFVGRTIDEHNETPLMQVYWPENDTWSVVAAPSVVPCDAVKFQGRLFTFQGINSGTDSDLETVEEYDPLCDSWRLLPDFQFENETTVPTLIVLNENMYAYDCFNSRYVFCWDVEQDMWKPVSESSHLMELHGYNFYTMEEPEALKKFMSWHRNPRWKWVKSPLV